MNANGILKRRSSADNFVNDTSVYKVRVVEPAENHQKERRIEALEREIESLHEEVANLTYCEAESLQTAKAAGSQLYKDKLLCEAQISRLEAQNRQLIKKLSLAQSNMRQMKEVLVQTDDRDETQATEHAHGLTKREAVVQTSDDSSFDICGKIPSISGICNEEVIDHSSAPDVSIVPDTRLPPGGSDQPDSARPNSIPYPTDAVTEQAMLWFPDAFAYVDVGLGAEFTDLLLAWIALERSSQWNTNPQVRLPTSNRPALLARWVDKKRYNTKGNEPLKEECGIDFSENVKQWWVSLQPEWRRTACQESSASSDSNSRQQQDWSRIDKFGINGWYGIIVCLKWWGENLQYREGGSAARQEWVDTLKDVCNMMKDLTRYRVAQVN